MLSEAINTLLGRLYARLAAEIPLRAGERQKLQELVDSALRHLQEQKTRPTDNDDSRVWPFCPFRDGQG